MGPLLFYGNSYHHPDIYGSMRFLSPDPFISLAHGEERIIVGVNRFSVSEPPPKDLLKIKPEVEIAQKKALAAVKGERDQAAVDR